jgi:HD-like signal output (HDOD) protein
MPRLSYRDLEPGVVVSEDVRNPRGQLLIPAGTALTEKHLNALKLWGISAVSVDAGDASAGDERTEEVSSEALEQARVRAEELLALNGSAGGHPARAALFDICVGRLLKHGAPGEGASESILDGQTRMSAAAEPAIGTPERLVQRLGTLGSLPAVYREMMEVVNHPLSSATDLANVISRDAGLTARLLRIVNSAFYGFPAKIETVSRATTVVGTSELCQLALATSVMTSFDKALGGVMRMSHFWLHSLCCGASARLLAKYKGEHNTERYFVIGLLHDVGRLAMLSEIPQATFKALESSAEAGKPAHEGEKEIIGFSHAAAGRALLEAWNLPPGQREAVGCHHTPFATRQYQTEAMIAHVSEVLTNAMCPGKSGDRLIPPLATKAWDGLGLDASMIVDVVDEAERQVAELAGLFGVNKES